MADARIIGIQHRIKQTTKQEAHPTRVVILSGNKETKYELETEEDELLFVHAQFPISWRDVEDADEPNKLPFYQVKWKRVPKAVQPGSLNQKHVKKSDEGWHVATKIAVEFDGFKTGDTVAMALGGSGDMFAYALSRMAHAQGGKVLRIPPFALKSERESRGMDKDDDAKLLAELVTSNLGLFYEVRPRDKNTILLCELYRQRIETMKARIAVEQRLRQRFIGSIFRSVEGPLSTDSSIEDLFNAQKANDVVLTNIITEEKRTERELEALIETLPIYRDVLHTVEGMGSKLASRIASGIMDVRRFATKAKFKAFCGVHVLPDGTFPRRRSGQTANWSGDVRQGLYLFVSDQCNRRPGSVWGAKLLGYKTKFRAKHPTEEEYEVEVTVKGKKMKRKAKRYTNGHIHKMAVWRTCNKFAEWLFKQWWKLEKGELPTKAIAA